MAIKRILFHSGNALTLIAILIIDRMSVSHFLLGIMMTLFGTAYIMDLPEPSHLYGIIALLIASILTCGSAVGLYLASSISPVWDHMYLVGASLGLLGILAHTGILDVTTIFQGLFQDGNEN